jgi:hypothetical protein
MKKKCLIEKSALPLFTKWYSHKHEHLTEDDQTLPEKDFDLQFDPLADLHIPHE